MAGEFPSHLPLVFFGPLPSGYVAASSLYRLDLGVPNGWVVTIRNPHLGPRILRIKTGPIYRDTPKWSGENNGKTLLKLEDLGVKPTIFRKRPIYFQASGSFPSSCILSSRLKLSDCDDNFLGASVSTWSNDFKTCSGKRHVNLQSYKQFSSLLIDFWGQNPNPNLHSWLESWVGCRYKHSGS